MCFSIYLWITKRCTAMSESPKVGAERRGVSTVWRQYLAAAASTLLALSCGTMLAWTSPVLPLLKQFGSRPTLDDDQGSWVGSLVTLGAFIGATPAGRLADSFGRKRILILVAVPFYTAWSILLWSVSATGLYFGRLLAGFTIGVVSVATPTYINEISDTSVRGTLGTFFQLQLVLGVFLMYIIALWGEVFMMTLTCSFLPVLFLAIFPWFPESPLWLASRGRDEEAKAALQWFHGPPTQTDMEMTEAAEKNDTKDETTIKLQATRVVPLWKDRAAVKGLLISLSLMLIQQMSGVNAVVFYTNKIYEISGTSISAFTASLLTATVQLIATLLSTVLVDRCGRRLLLLISTSVMTMCLGSLGFYIFLTKERGLSLPGLSLLPVISLCTYSTVFNLGCGPVPWLMMSELVNPHYRGAVSAMTAALSWGLAFLVTKYFHGLTVVLGVGQTFLFFAVWMFAGAVFILAFVPETKGKTAEQVAAKLGTKRKNRNNI